jgi:putative MFS transporter
MVPGNRCDFRAIIIERVGRRIMSRSASIREWTFDEAIQSIGFGSFQRRLMVICGTGWAADAMEVLIIAFVLPAIIKEWGLTTAQAGFLGTSVFLGMLVGAWFWGTISDYIGRKIGFQATVLIDSVFGLLSALSPNFLVLVLLRALTGFGVGGTLPVDYSIFAEYLPKEKRGRYLVYLESFWALGTIVVAGLAWLVVPRFGWRVLLAISALPGLIIYFIRRYVPESPRYLLVAGREAEARAVLQEVAARNGVDFSVERLKVEERKQRVTVAALLTPRFARTTLMLWIAWFCISLGYYGVFSWLPKIFVGRGFTFFSTYQNVFLMALAQLPGYFSAAYLVERVGRKPTLAVYLIVSGLFTYLFAVAGSLSLIVGSAVLMSFFCLGAWGGIYAYTPELYPTEIRSTGMGSASGMTRIAGAMAPILGGYLLPISLVAALSLYAVAFVVGGLTVFALGTETRGKPLEDTVT